ncbi:MAG: hypothetical protein PCFJNLEI_01177 [Verrucomicrobiae bacterium]|nr:hypothetical protein [Verrucomicrobiae bacterium]
MSIQNRAHYKLATAELAKWLETQGDDCWWSVDGDPLLTGLVSFPSPSSELAEALRQINIPLLLQDKNDAAQATGQQITASDLNRLAETDDVGNRSFLLGWENSPADDLGWLLVEDRESARSSSSSSAATSAQ